MSLDWEVFHEGARAADALLAKVYRVEVTKSLNPLETKDFEKICRDLAQELKGHAKPVEDLALKKAVTALDVDWGKMTPAARLRVVELAQTYLGPPVIAKTLPKIEDTFTLAAKDIVAGTKSKAKSTFDLNISPSMSLEDKRIMDFVAASQSHYVRDQFGKRRDDFGAKAKLIVAAGIEKGHGSEEIAERLHKELGPESGRGIGYWDMIAMVFANRARTLTELASFGEAGITHYTWHSVLDEVTSAQCRFMHGRIFPVQHALSTFRAVEESDDPEAIERIQPFMSYSQGQLYLGRKNEQGAAPHVAFVTSSGVGFKDRIGEYQDAVSTHDLMSSGVLAPPLHGRCRSTIIPHEGAVEHVPPPAVGGGGPSKSATALESLAALPKTSDVTVGSPFPVAPELPDGIPWNEVLASPGVSKKPKLDELTATLDHMDPTKVELFIKSPKALASAATPRVVKFEGKNYILDGHEMLAAQKLLGQKLAYVSFIDADAIKAAKPPPPPVPIPQPPPPPPPVVVQAPVGIHDPKEAVTWKKRAAHEHEVLNGVAWSKPEPEFWKKHVDVDVGEPAVTSPPAGKKWSSGLLVVEPDGRVWFVEPKGHFGGYENTFPKGKASGSLTLQQNALKETFEEAGLEGEILGHVGDFEGNTSITRFYVARRKGGQPWTSHHETESVKLATIDDAKKAMNTQRDKDIVDALKTYLLGKPLPQVPKAPPPPPPHAPIAPALAAAPGQLDAGTILGQKIGAAAGSNAGGVYRGTDGVERYVKFYGDKAQAAGEHLANTLYNSLGHKAPRSWVFEHDGKFAYASEMIGGAKTLGHAGLTPERAQDAMRGFLLDVLTGNWDAVGTGLDNMMVDVNGKIIRVDNGGSFLMRAKAGRKPLEALNTITEWTGFFDSGKNPYYAKVANAAGYNEARDMRDVLLPEMKRVQELQIAHGGWAGFVEKHAPMLPAADKDRIINMLEARTARLQGKIDELARMPAKPKPLPRGKDFEAPSGERVKPPPIDKENLERKSFDDLPKRSLPKGLDTPPDGSSVRAYRETIRKLGIEKAIESASSDSRDVIRTFSGSSYTSLRHASALSREDFDAKHGPGSYNRWKERADKMEDAFGKVQPVPGQVFRGLRDISRSTIDMMLEQDYFDLRGTASSSRTAEVALNFKGGTSGSSTRVLLVIHQKTGIGIETISSHASENEVLLSRSSKLRVLNRHRADENPAILIIECEEEVDSYVAPEEPAKKPRRRRKPAGVGSAP